ncbi:MAG: RidA family protein [Sphingomonadales bacterium]
MELLNPPGWPRPKGYSNGVSASGRLVFTAGVVGWTKDEVFEHADMTGQFRQALENIVAILAAGNAGPEHIVRMTWFITDKQEYLDNAPEIGRIYRDIIGKHFPVMAVVHVSGLMEDAAKVEIETTAVVPE